MKSTNTCRILTSTLTLLVLCTFAKAQLGAYGLPSTVLLGKGGNAAGTQGSSGAADSLRHLLDRTSQSVHSNTRELSRQDQLLSPNSRGAKVIDPPRTESTVPPRASPKTIFVFANGERLEAGHYVIDAGFLHLADGGQQRTIPLSTLDIKTTVALNRERGIDLKIPQSRSEVTIAF